MKLHKGRVLSPKVSWLFKETVSGDTSADRVGVSVCSYQPSPGTTASTSLPVQSHHAIGGSSGLLWHSILGRACWTCFLLCDRNVTAFACLYLKPKDRAFCQRPAIDGTKFSCRKNTGLSLFACMSF